jgi:Flp pilus assembly protein TadD
MGKWGFLRGAAGLSALLSVVGAVVPATQEQASPNLSSQSPATPAHRVKVWTNEELIATRTPADLYIFQKEAQAAALEIEGFNNLAACFAFGQPEGDAEETQKEIDTTLQSIRDSEQAVAQSRKALSTSPDNLKLRNQMELAQRMSELNHAREHLWTLQEHLQELEKKSPPEPATHSSN